MSKSQAGQFLNWLLVVSGSSKCRTMGAATVNNILDSTIHLLSSSCGWRGSFNVGFKHPGVRVAFIAAAHRELWVSCVEIAGDTGASDGLLGEKGGSNARWYWNKKRGEEKADDQVESLPYYTLRITQVHKYYTLRMWTQLPVAIYHGHIKFKVLWYLNSYRFWDESGCRADILSVAMLVNALLMEGACFRSHFSVVFLISDYSVVAKWDKINKTCPSWAMYYYSLNYCPLKTILLHSIAKIFQVLTLQSELTKSYLLVVLV